MDPAVNEQYYLLVAAKLRETAAHVIAMSVLVLNLRKIQRALLRMLAYLLEILAQNKNWALVQWTLVRPLETGDRKSTRLNSSHIEESRMPSSA